MAECPFIDRSIEWDDAHLEAVDHPLGDGSTYCYYKRQVSKGNDVFNAAFEYSQFCQHIGRKLVVFECLNDWQWVNCSHFRANLDQLPAGFKLADAPALI